MSMLLKYESIIPTFHDPNRFSVGNRIQLATWNDQFFTVNSSALCTEQVAKRFIC